MGQVFFGRFGNFGLTRPTVCARPPAPTSEWAPDPARPGYESRSTVDCNGVVGKASRWIETRTAAELAAAGAVRVMGNIFARQVTAAGGTAAEVTIANAAGQAAAVAQQQAAAQGATPEQQQAAAVAAMKLAAEKMQAAIKAGATPKQAADAVVGGSNTIYYIAGGLAVVGLIGTLVFMRKRSAPMPRPALAGYNRRRGGRRASWIR